MIDEAKLKTMTLVEIQHEIEIREAMLQQMIGNLYPSILWSELDQLVSKRTQLMCDKDNNSGGTYGVFVNRGPNMIYLASPYSHPDRVIRIKRFEDVCQAAGYFMREGLHIFCPIAHTHPIAEIGDLPKGFDFWEKYDRWFVDNCNEVYVLMLEGWEQSTGVTAEIKMAKEQNKPVKYFFFKDGIPIHTNL